MSRNLEAGWRQMNQNVPYNAALDRKEITFLEVELGKDPES